MSVTYLASFSYGAVNPCPASVARAQDAIAERDYPMLLARDLTPPPLLPLTGDGILFPSLNSRYHLQLRSNGPALQGPSKTIRLQDVQRLGHHAVKFKQRRKGHSTNRASHIIFLKFFKLVQFHQILSFVLFHEGVIQTNDVVARLHPPPTRP